MPKDKNKKAKKGKNHAEEPQIEESETEEEVTEPEVSEDLPKSQNGTFLEVPLSKITQFTRERVRIDEKVNQEDIEIPAPSEEEFQKGIAELAQNIKSHGLIEPIVIRPLESGNYELVCGYRRFLAHKLNDSETIQAKIEDLTEEQSTDLWLFENIYREDLSDFDKFKVFNYWLEKGKTQKWIAKHYNIKNVQTVQRILGLRKVIPEVQKAVEEGKVSIDVALKMKDLPEDQQEQVLETAIQEGKSASEVKAEVDELKKAEEDAKRAEEELNAKVDALNAEIDAKKQRLSQLKTKYKQKSDLLQRRKDLKGEINQLAAKTKDKDDAKSKFDDFLKNLEKDKQELAKLIEQKDEKQAEKTKYSKLDKTKVDRAVMKFNKEIEDLEREKQAETENIQKLMEELKKKNELILQINTNLESSKRAKREITSNYDNQQLLALKINDIDFKIGELQRSIDESETHYQTQLKILKTLDDQLSKETEALIEKQKEATTVKATLDALKGINKSEIDKTNRELEKLEKQLAEVIQA